MAIAEKEYSKKDLGQYFTPKVVADFTLEMARNIAGPKLDKCARVVDPACGAGAFLLSALYEGIGNPRTIFGIDIDPSVKAQWESNGLSTALGGNLHIQNGLYDSDDGRISEKLSMRKFDLVVGNPPYGGIGVRGVQEDKKLLQTLKTYELWRPLNNHNDNNQESLFAPDIWNRIKRLTRKEVERLERFPIEVLFLERFVRLARDGGVIAIIIPDGILANTKFNYVRNWLVERCQVYAIVALPRGTFRRTGTTAKTSLLFLKKDAQGTTRGTGVFMAQLKDGFDGGTPTKADFSAILAAFKDKDKIYAHKSPVMWRTTTTDDLWDNRWDAEYWDPSFTEPIRKLEKRFGKLITIGETKPYITYGAIITKRAPRIKTEGVLYINPPNFTFAGFDIKAFNYIAPNSDWNAQKSRLKKYDVLIVRAGVGCAGRVELFDLDAPGNVGCYVDIVRQNEINPYYLTIFLKSKFGALQFSRLKCGVATLNINFEEIKSIKLPELSEKAVLKIEKFYRRILKSHYELNSVEREEIVKLIIKGETEKEAEKEICEKPEYVKRKKSIINDMKNLMQRFEGYLESKIQDI